MHPHRPTFVRAVLTAGLLLALVASQTASAQEAVEAPAGDAAYAVEQTAAAPVMEVQLDQPVLDPLPSAAPTPLPTLAPTPAPNAAPAPDQAAPAAPTAPAPGAPVAAAANVAAVVVDNRFDPKALTIAVGSTVTWTNNGNNIHTLTSSDGLFDSGGLLGGQSFSFKFDKAGTYRLICRQHGLNGMGAQVIVQ
jgi:plastocyanin